MTYSGTQKNSKEAIIKVSQLMESNPKLALSLDHDMEKSVLMAEKALQMNKEKGLDLLMSAIQHAGRCFKAWELITPQLEQHINQLLHLGALAAKPTGAGYGGYVLSLWQNPPPLEVIAKDAVKVDF